MVWSRDRTGVAEGRRSRTRAKPPASPGCGRRKGARRLISGSQDRADIPILAARIYLRQNHVAIDARSQNCTPALWSRNQRIPIFLHAQQTTPDLRSHVGRLQARRFSLPRARVRIPVEGTEVALRLAASTPRRTPAEAFLRRSAADAGRARMVPV